MKSLSVLVCTTVMSVGPVLLANATDGEALFNQLCVTCHTPGGPDEPRLAPPPFAVQNHYRQVHADKAAFVAAVVAWLESPDESATLMPGAIRRFGLMPAQSLSDEQRQAVATYLYDRELTEPSGYQQHFKRHHGSGSGQAQ